MPEGSFTADIATIRATARQRISQLADLLGS
jgi:hypothetical protein